jgi:hypothetical protein
MCDEANCNCDEFETSYLDGATLDVSIVEAILEPYPELWAWWQTKMIGPEAEAKLTSGDMRMYYSPTYLRRVVNEHLYLLGGGQGVASELEAECEAIAAGHPVVAENRRRALFDPWWRAMPMPDNWSVSRYYDPAWLQRSVEMHRREDDPFSKTSMELKWFRDTFPPSYEKPDVAEFN